MASHSQKLCAVFISILLILQVTAFSCFRVPAKAYAPLSGGTWFFGGPQDDWAYSIVLTSDVGLAIAGYTKSYGSGGSDMWLVKTGIAHTVVGNKTVAYQREQWRVAYGGPQEDVAKCVIQTSDGGYALAGYTNSSGAGGYDMWLVKTDLNGYAQWNMTYGGPQDDMANCVVQTSEGGYLLAGYANSFDVPFQTTWLVKTDSFGNLLWNRTYTGEGGNSLVKTSDGGYALATSYSNAFSLIKLDSSGEMQWSRTYPGSSYDAEAEAVIQTNDGGYAMAGWTMASDTGLYAARLVKTDSSGNVQWDQTYGRLGVYSVVQTSDGGYAMAGDRACLIITDSYGNVMWNQNYDSLTEDNLHFTRACSIIQASPNNFVMAGVQESYGMMPSGYGAIMVSVAFKTDSTPPTITVLSPENNEAYAPDSVPLTFYVSNSTVWIGYCIDKGLNVTISGNTTLPKLTEGPHNITVYASDVAYNAGASDTIYFSSETVYFTISESLVAETPPQNPSQTSPQIPKQTTSPESSEPFPLIWIATASALVVAVGVAGLVYFKKSRKTTSQVRRIER
jgi:hypothetical protein